MQAQEGGINVVLGTPYIVTVKEDSFCPKGNECSSRWKRLLEMFPAACFNKLYPLLAANLADYGQQSVDGRSITVRWMGACIISEDVGDRYASKEFTARASVLFHRREYFSDVAIQGEDAGQPADDWIARVIAFFEVKSSNGDVVHMAFVRFYEKCGEDALTGFPLYRWARRASERCGIVDVNTILRVVHMVPKTWNKLQGVDDKGMVFSLNMDKSL